MAKTIVVVGGGAAGFFGAVAYAAENPQDKVILLEKTRQPLAKVRISGGGRCNVTHHCYDPRKLVSHYPRGNKALLGPFNRFQPEDTIAWFSSRGVELKIEQDGRIFPRTDTSQTIIDCLYQEAKSTKVDIRLQSDLIQITKEGERFLLTLEGDKSIDCDKVLIATGSNSKMFRLLEELGHKIQPAVPSLFTFNIPNPRLTELSGVSVPKAKVVLPEVQREETGPLLITHWGLSGPAILKLSAWGARDLQALNYKTLLQINWLGDKTKHQGLEDLRGIKKRSSRKCIGVESGLTLPKQLWKFLLEEAKIEPIKLWAHISNAELEKLAAKIYESEFSIDGKSTNKEEFVTCGGVDLDQVNFQTMESRLVPGLFFAGEVLDIDGITGGFNFQNAWTTSWLAARGLSLS